jgi:hypothetical protein
LNNARNTPNILPAIVITANAFALPLYFQGFNGNFLFLEPSYIYTFMTVSVLFFTMLVMKMQHNKPRFFLSRDMKKKLAGADYY